MKKLLSTLEHFSVRQKLFLGVIFLALLPTAGMLAWGINRAVRAPEFIASDWTNPVRRIPSPTP